MKKKVKTKRVYGIADCHGIESYIEDEKKVGFMVMRAMLNRQRHAVVYMTEVTQDIDESMKRYIEKQDWKGALKLLKQYGVTFPERYSEQFKNSWSLIPNDKLDPWG